MRLPLVRELRKHPLLDRDDMQSERTPSDLMLWVDQKDVAFQYRQDELRRQLPHKDYCKAEDALYQHPLTKIFMEEIRPLAFFASRKFGYREDVRIKPCVGNQNYDAIVNDMLCRDIIHVETTTTLDGHETKIQIEHMRRYGSAPAFTQIQYTGTANKGYRIQQTQPIGVEREDMHNREFTRIRKRFIAKNKKEYPEGTWLLVAFDDYLGFTSQRDIRKLTAFAAREISPNAQNFGKIILMGWSGENWIEF
jgi:hypothetical protein